MTHPSEEQLTLFYYGDAEDAASFEQHLAACAACRASFAALKQALAAVESAPVPERGAGYGREVWARLEPRLDERPGWSWLDWFQPKRVALAGALGALLVVAFYAGRITRTGVEEAGPSGVGVPAPEQVRERILLVAVGDHLERSQMVLVELINARPNGEVNITMERNRAEELVVANRLYRQTAAGIGDAAVESVLDELERVLLEIARGPEKISGPELAALQRRIEAKGILFKVRVTGSQVREREKAPPGEPARGRS
jgi:hypothetical protein